MTSSDIPRDAYSALLARIAEGDAAAEEELITLFRRPVYAIAMVRTGERGAAQDITQEVLIAVLEAARRGTIREPEKLHGYIHSVTKFTVSHHFREKGRRAEASLDEADSSWSDPVPEFEAAERRRLVREELATCGPVDQKILLFSMVDGLSLAVIAERLKLSHEAVRARKSRLIRKLAKKFVELSQKPPKEPLS